MKIIRALSRRTAFLTIAVTTTAMIAGLAPAAFGVGVGVNQATPVSPVPSAITPNVQDGVVYAITQVGSQVIIGGSFTTVQNHGSTTNLSRPYVLAFDTSTGAVSATFVPTLDGTVEAVAPGPTANTVYVGGAFNNVNGTKSKGITLLSTTTGAIVSGFKPPNLNGIVYAIGKAGSRVLLAGTFTTASGIAHGGLASLNGATGALDPFMNVQLAGHHNYNGSGANGGVGARSMAINPAGTQAMVIGNFKTADGNSRDQAVMIDLDGATAAVDQNWATSQFTAACFSWAFDTYVTDVQFSQDGSYFAITATGGSGTNNDGTNSLCDTVSRWETSATGANVKPTWVDYTGQDSLWSVAITGSAIYVGGHERWLNNSNGYDYPGAGAVPRPGLAAVDPASGTPLSWNPGRHPRGAGAYAVYASSTGLYVGSDTDWVGNYRYKRQKISYFPLAGGTAAASTTTTQLPSNLYEAGQLPNSTNTNVLYRVDAGGPAVQAIDNGPDWAADQSGGDPGAQYHNADSSTAGYSCCVTMSTTVPASTPAGIFNSERWDPGSNNDGDEMQWSFPVPAGTHVDVRLYFANRYSGTSQVGQRVFDVGIDGTTMLDHYDIVADAGDQVGTMKDFAVTSPSNGTITINFTHEVENPLINGIELINLDSQAGGSAVNDLAYRAMSGNQIGALTTVPGTGVSWSATRGAFMLGNTIFYGDTDGNFYRATFDGTKVGTPQIVDPYDDPYWSDVQTGSGQTYRGTKPSFYNEMSSVTGAFYADGRVYYALLGQPNLLSRWFNPDSGIMGSQEFTTVGGDFSNIAGMVLSGSTLYYADRSTGALHKMSFANDVPDSSTDQIVSGPSLDGNDWRSRGMFLFGAPSFPNQLPTAHAVATCTQLRCDFDGSTSSDPDGSIASYAWDYGDGAHGTGATPSHTYASSGSYDVSLVVTDDRGGSSAPWTDTETVTGSSVQVAFVGKDGTNSKSSASPSVTVPSGITAGDTEFLFVTTATAGLTTSSPTGLTGWQKIATRTNAPLETTVFQRVATAGDSGKPVTVPLASATAVDLRLVDYSGVAGGAPTLATAGDSNKSDHVTPSVAVDSAGSWVLSYWADRNSSTSTWSLPSSVISRTTGVGTGGGHVDAALADSGQAVTANSYGGLTASTGVVSGKGDMITIVLAPGVAN